MRRALFVVLAVLAASVAGPVLRGPGTVSAGTTAPDLTVTGMVIELETGSSCAFPSTQLGVRVTVANNGTAAAGPFVVDVNGDQQTMNGLAPGATLSLWFPGYQAGSNTATVDATNMVFESNEGNNQLTQTLPVPTLPAPCTPTRTATPTVAQATPTATDTPTPTDTAAATPTVTATLTATDVPTSSSTPTLESNPTAAVAASGLPGTGLDDAGGESTPVSLISALLAGGAAVLIGLAAVRLRRR